MFFLLGSDSLHQVVLVGTKTGKPYKSEESCERARKYAEKKKAHLDWLVLEVNEVTW